MTQPPQTAGKPPAIDGPLVRTAFVLVLGTFMAALDTTIVTVAIDTLATRFGATVAEIQWASTAYLLAVVAAVPMAGWLVDRIGGRRTWLIAVVVFLVGSLLCALSWSIASLVVFRILQGLGGGLLPPTGQALLARAAGPQRIGRILAVVGIVPLLAPVFGPLIGGALLTGVGWQWIFLVNLPIGLVAILLGLRVVAADQPRAAGAPLDVRGVLLLSPGLAVFVFGLTRFTDRQADQPWLAWLAVVVGAAMLAGFWWHGMRATNPLIDPRVFTRPPLGAAAVALLVAGVSVFGALFLLPLYLQAGRGLTPWETGLVLAPQGIGAVIGTVLVSKLVDRVAPRVLVASGMALAALGTVVFTQLALAPSDLLIAASLLVRGFGIAMIGTPVMAVVYRSVERPQVPRTSSALNMLNTIGGSVGTAVMAVILDSRLTARGPDGTAAAFADTFWVALVLCVVAIAFVTRLRAPARTDSP